MADHDNPSTSVLLPTASVAVFSQDSETLEAARAISKDWRFARVNVQVYEGDAAMAIELYAGAPSPDLVIVQSETIDDAFTDSLEDLAGNCDEGTAAIVVGPVNDVYLYRKLIDMGVSDYLVRPIETPVICEVIAKALITRIGASGSRLLAVIGAKGGVGTTMTAQALALYAANVLGTKTALLDAAGGMSTLAPGLGFESVSTLQEAARAAGRRDQDSLDRIMPKIGGKLNVLASGSDPMLEEPISATQFEEILDMLMVVYPLVVVDLSCGGPDLKRAVISRANTIAAVATPTILCLRQARTLLQELQELRGNSAEGISLIANMQGLHASGEVSKGDIQAALDCAPSGFVPFESRLMMRLESEGKAITDDKDGLAFVIKHFGPLADRLIQAGAQAEETTTAKQATKQGFLGGFLTKLTAKS